MIYNRLKISLLKINQEIHWWGKNHNKSNQNNNFQIDNLNKKRSPTFINKKRSPTFKIKKLLFEIIAQNKRKILAKKNHNKINNL